MDLDPPEAAAGKVSVVGHRHNCGVYLVRIVVSRDLRIRFGRFAGGARIPLSPGTYVYVGSAMGSGQTRALALRIVRHATRTGSRRPHRIRRELMRMFVNEGLLEQGWRPRTAKHLRWHVDYLLDASAAEIDRVVAIRSARRLEGRLAQRLASDEGIEIVRKGLGASDHPGATHLFRVRGGDDVWEDIVREVRARHG